MSDVVRVIAVVEGKTEQNFVRDILAPYLGAKNVSMYATQVSKSGQKGGDVRFSRVLNDLGKHLKQERDIYVTTLIDYYGVKEWPGLDDVPVGATPAYIAHTINTATKEEVERSINAHRVEERFIPFMAIHEFEAFLFSDSAVIASELNIAEAKVRAVLEQCGEPEAINNSPQTAPSKRLDTLSPNGRFPKTTMGIYIAELIGIDVMRQKCPVFNSWIETLETLESL